MTKVVGETIRQGAEITLFFFLQRSLRADQKGDEGESRQGRKHRADAELPEGTSHPATVQSKTELPNVLYIHN